MDYIRLSLLENH